MPPTPLSPWQPAGDAVVRELAGPDYEAYNTVFEPCAIQETVRSASLNGFRWEAELQPHSVCIVEARVNGAAAALNRIG